MIFIFDQVKIYPGRFMATITIERSNEFTNRMREFIILIDGVQAGTIANGTTKAFTVPPGQHRLVAKIDWCSSPELLIDVKADDNSNVKVSGFKYANWLIGFGAVILAIHFILQETMQIYYGIFFLAPLFFMLLYYLTLGRNKYLTLTELK